MALQDYIPKEEKLIRTGVQLTESQIEWLDKVAKETGVSRSKTIRIAVNHLQTILEEEGK